MADIPAGTGLGSSGSFTTALLKALHAHRKNLIPRPNWPSRPATSRSTGWGSRSASRTSTSPPSAGSLPSLPTTAGSSSGRCKISEETLYNLEDNLLLFFTGYSRSASAILKDQNDRSKKQDPSMLDNLHFTKELGYKSLDCPRGGNLRGIRRAHGRALAAQEGAQLGMSNAHINEWYDHAMANGALGGKLIGAGGGGFLMFYAGDKKRLRHAMREKGLQEVRFRFDFEGTKVVAQN